MGQKSDIDVGFNEKIIDEESAIKVIQMYKIKFLTGSLHLKLKMW